MSQAQLPFSLSPHWETVPRVHKSISWATNLPPSPSPVVQEFNSLSLILESGYEWCYVWQSLEVGAVRRG
jgi:hypothetical protein